MASSRYKMEIPSELAKFNRWKHTQYLRVGDRVLHVDVPDRLERVNEHLAEALRQAVRVRFVVHHPRERQDDGEAAVE